MINWDSTSRLQLDRNNDQPEQSTTIMNPYIDYVNMEDVHEKLKLLNYESDFIQGNKFRPIHKFYFAAVTNPGEQFHLFCSLSAWLIHKCGRKMKQPQEDDDPNETVGNIIATAQSMGLMKSVDVAPNKLMQGVGESVILLLNCLANEALKRSNFKWEKLQIPEEADEQIETVDEDASELNLDRVEEEMLAYYSDSNEDNDELIVDRQGNHPAVDGQQRENDVLMPVIGDVTDGRQSGNALAATTSIISDEQEWRMEVERVSAQLRITVRNQQQRDWRAHYAQLQQLHAEMSADFQQTVRPQLERLRRDVTAATEKVASREKFLNRELAAAVEEYRRKQEHLANSTERLTTVSRTVAERNRQLTKLTERMESVRQQTDVKGSSMTDGTPLVHIKKAVTKLKTELREMNVRIGVLECVLRQARIGKEKQLNTEFDRKLMRQ